MGISKQAKILSTAQIKAVLSHLETGRNSRRNSAIFLLSVKGGLRAKEIALLEWSMVLNADGEIGNAIHLTNNVSKGKSGRIIPLQRSLKDALGALYQIERHNLGFDRSYSRVVRTERSCTTTPQTVVNMFADWYRRLGFVGCSSHSGRRTFITNAARKIGTVGGSLRDVQLLAGHTNLQTTQRYIEFDTNAQRKVVDLI